MIPHCGVGVEVRKYALGRRGLGGALADSYGDLRCCLVWSEPRGVDDVRIVSQPAFKRLCVRCEVAVAE